VGGAAAGDPRRHPASRGVGDGAPAPSAARSAARWSWRRVPLLGDRALCVGLIERSLRWLLRGRGDDYRCPTSWEQRGSSERHAVRERSITVGRERPQRRELAVLT
jgi:hypothetical protein